jgi:CTP synthase (UTP-ammonia lyase)
MRHTRIALIGDYSSSVKAHVAIPLALCLVAKNDNVEIEPIWIHTSELANAEALPRLRDFDGIWCVSASPYTNREGAFSAIKLARTEGIPCLGTCAGFRYGLVEYFRNVIGVIEAEHAEENPESRHQVISRLSCSLVEATDTVWLTPGSLVSNLYGTDHVEEAYRCDFGFNPQYASLMAGRNEIRIEGRDAAGNLRIFRLLHHPFFLLQDIADAFIGMVHVVVAANRTPIVHLRHFIYLRASDRTGHATLP